MVSRFGFVGDDDDILTELDNLQHFYCVVKFVSF